MMNAMSLLKRKTVPVGELSPTRLDLVKALANLAIVQAEADGVRSVSSASHSSIFAAKNAISLAETGVEEALAAAVQQAVDTVQGIPSKPVLTVQEARNVLQNARDNLVAVTGMRKALEAKEAEVAALFPPAERAVERAAKAVIQVEAADYGKALVAEVRQLQKTLFDRGFALEWLAGIGVFETRTDYGDFYGKPLDEETRQTVNSMHYRPGDWHANPALKNRAPIWDQALAALMVDGSAVLPMPGGGS